MSDAASPPYTGTSQGPPKKKKRTGVDASLILDAPRQRKRREGSREVDLPSTRGRVENNPNVRARTAEEFQEVQRLGMILYDKLIAQVDPHDSSRPLWPAFGQLPSPQSFPDYYQMIKKPIALDSIKQKLDNRNYVCLADVRTDMNQIFVNAKRYNAPGSPLFLDAKKLHKTLKDTYAVLTGEAPPPEEDDAAEDIQVGAPSSEPPARAPAPQRGGTALKNYIQKKLDELKALTDDDGRSLVEYFEVLPDRKWYPDYYQIIENPIAIDIIQSRITKRGYSDVNRFIADVQTIFSNAFYYNEEASLVWQDAAKLKKHFERSMNEPTPDFGPKRPAAPKRRRGSSVLPSGDEDHDEDDGSEYGGSPQVYASELPSAPTSDPYGGLLSHSPSLTPANASPVITANTALPSGLSFSSISGVDPNPLHNLASLAAFSPAAVGANGLDIDVAGSPLMGNGVLGSSSRPGTSRSGSEGVVHHPRRVAKLPAIGEVPLVSHFLVTSLPASLPSFTLDNSQIRQHSFAVPFSTQTLHFTPVFRGSSADGKGKSKANGADFSVSLNGHSNSNGGLDLPPPSISIRAKPATLPFEPVLLPSHSSSSSSSAGETSYALTPRQGLSVVEFFVRPLGAEEGDGSEEVYRCFVTK
ncbi:hypothetical protein JCM8097_009487 [Rhodosporidiobolus ruineniae]